MKYIFFLLPLLFISCATVSPEEQCKNACEQVNDVLLVYSTPSDNDVYVDCYCGAHVVKEPRTK